MKSGAGKSACGNVHYLGGKRSQSKGSKSKCLAADLGVSRKFFFPDLDGLSSFLNWDRLKGF